MEAVSRNPSVIMVNKNLAKIPHYPLTEGYSLRWFQKGDEISWRKVQLENENFNDIPKGLFTHDFSNNLQAHSKRICFVERLLDGHIVGTAAAWWKESSDKPELGRVHWVAIIPSFQGLGLSKGLLSAVCQRLQELGHEQAYLTTSTTRLPALNLYRLFGFQAVAENEQEWKEWKFIEQDLKLGLGDDFPKKSP